jgi:diaminohydroxyphosphoribosylaminopyrimidine deaminase/5-amino-6-(5-phosphoribosylamino)uracil reductase
VTPLDRLFLERANELARRGLGNTSPNPAVGAVVVLDGVVVGEGYHHRAGEPHAETHALAAAGDRARGATLYVSLEPCNHHGRTPPCAQAVAAAGVARVVVGAVDPNPKTDGGGIRFLRERGIEVDVIDDRASRAIVEPFARAILGSRPFVALKMAMSLDGYVAAEPEKQHWLTGDAARAFVRELRIAFDAIVVGAGTIRVDNPQLTVRPPHARAVPYRRVIFCENYPVERTSRVFAAAEGYDRTIVAVPAGAQERFRPLEEVANVLYVGSPDAQRLDVGQALRELSCLGISSLLCEGGPMLAGHLYNADLVDRVYLLVAPQLLRGPQAVPVLGSQELFERGLRFDGVERLDDDLLLCGTLSKCSAD